MKCLFLIVLSFLIKVDLSIAQKRYTDIPFVEISDSTLVSNINKIVDREVNSDSTQYNPYSKGYGYVILNVKEYSKGDTLVQYYISPMWLSYKEDTQDSAYPDAYSYVGGQLVIIRLSVLTNFVPKRYSANTKKRLRNLINSRLQKAKKITLYQGDKNKAVTDKNFRIDYIKFDAGIYIYMRKNKPPIIIKE